jgi:NAD(P)-dependent dehydrogenase (short-subunit alcohol dehydrogenase family)
MSVKGRVALITGSGSGIGKAIAIKLAKQGAAVIINDLQSEKVDEAVAEIKGITSDVIGLTADVTKKEDVQNLVKQAVEHFNRIDILVNNVGISRDRKIENMSEEDWDAVLNVNLKSYFLCTQAVIPYFKEQQYGRIINISSRAWLGGHGQANYSAAKGGIVSLTRTTAIELAKHHVTANSIAPGLIDTPLFQSFREDVKERLLKIQPIDRIGQPEEVANAVSFFASDESGYITGQTLHVCGGKSLGARW